MYILYLSEQWLYPNKLMLLNVGHMVALGDSSKCLNFAYLE